MQGKKTDAGKRCKVVIMDDDDQKVRDAMLLEKDVRDESWSIFVFDWKCVSFASYPEILEIGDFVAPR